MALDIKGALKRTFTMANHATTVATLSFVTSGAYMQDGDIPKAALYGTLGVVWLGIASLNRATDNIRLKQNLDNSVSNTKPVDPNP